MGKVNFSQVDLFTTRDGRKITYEQLLGDIYENSEESRESMRTLLDQMTSLISSPAEAVMLMQHITTLLEARIKNDDLLVKVASIVSRIVQKSLDSKGDDDGFLLISEEERKQLLDAYKSTEAEIVKTPKSEEDV
jgi:hypothetical protein